jgi:glycosyltransferase involved in cell wall biosynthesis
VSEARAAEILRESAIFMSFGHPEGFGLPPAEAMAAGCIVVGYHGNGGREFFTTQHGFPIEVGDILGYAQTMERALEEYDRDPARLMRMAEDARRLVRDVYSAETEKNSIVECWEKILANSK